MIIFVNSANQTYYKTDSMVFNTEASFFSLFDVHKCSGVACTCSRESSHDWIVKLGINLDTFGDQNILPFDHFQFFHLELTATHQTYS